MNPSFLDNLGTLGGAAVGFFLILLAAVTFLLPLIVLATYSSVRRTEKMIARIGADIVNELRRNPPRRPN